MTMMSLTHDQLRTVARGVCAVEPVETGWTFRRLPQTAMTHYGSVEGQRIRSRCAAGVVLDFLTDSDVLAVQADIGAGARPPAFFDLYVENTMVGTMGDDEAPERVEGTFDCGPSSGLRRFQLYFPHVRIPTLIDVSLRKGCTVRASVPRPVWLALGDSITQGMSGTYPSLTYPALAARLRGYDLHNAGVGGAVFQPESLREKPVDNPALVSVAYGINDWNKGVPPDAACNMLTRLQSFYPDSPLFILEPIWFARPDRDPDEKNALGLTLAEYRSALATVAHDVPGARWIEKESLMPPGYRFATDGCHPNTLGHVVYGNNLATLIPPAPEA